MHLLESVSFYLQFEKHCSVSLARCRVRSRYPYLLLKYVFLNMKLTCIFLQDHLRSGQDTNRNASHSSSKISKTHTVVPRKEWDPSYSRQEISTFQSNLPQEGALTVAHERNKRGRKLVVTLVALPCACLVSTPSMTDRA